MPGDVTELLDALEHNDLKAAEELLPMVYHELRRLADIMMAGERPGHTLQPTALVHEAWLRLVGSNCEWRNRTHFVNTAAEAMRRVLVDRARQKGRLKRGGGWIRESFDSLDLAQAADDERLLLVNEAMDDLARGRPVEAQVVKLRYFVGLNHSEIAQALGLSEKTVRRYWNHAKLWMYQAIKSRLQA
jgi:RNA polymerase sigma factor (TIGR02999 family)